MRDQGHEPQWEVRMAYKTGWEARMAYYERLLRGVMELLEGTVTIMKVDGWSEAVKDLEKALLAIEDAWATLAWERTSSSVASAESDRESRAHPENDMERWPGSTSGKIDRGGA